MNVDNRKGGGGRISTTSWEFWVMDLRKGLLSLLLLLVSVYSLCAVDTAGSIFWQWTSEEEVEFFRYKFEGEDEWVVVPSEKTSLLVGDVGYGKDYTLYVESSYDGQKWSDPGVFTMSVPKKEQAGAREAAANDYFPRITIKTSLSFFSLGVYDFINGHGIAGAKYLTLTEPGISVKAQLGWRFSDVVSLYAEYGYSGVDKKETVIPAAHGVDHHSIALGVGVKVFSIGAFDMSAGFSAGCLFSLNAGYYSMSPIFGTVLDFGWTIKDHLRFGIGAGAGISYQPNSDPLYRSMTYLVDCVALTVETRF